MAKNLPMSRFIQNYNQHLAEAERDDSRIILQQRAGRPSWVLETESRAQATAEATEFLSGALAALVRDESMVHNFAEALASTLPWVMFLPPSDREAFATESVNTLRACASLGRYSAFSEFIEDWRNTAELWSDSTLAASLSRDIPEPLDIPVDLPTAATA